MVSETRVRLCMDVFIYTAEIYYRGLGLQITELPCFCLQYGHRLKTQVS